MEIMRLIKMAQKRHLDSWRGATIPGFGSLPLRLLVGVDAPDEAGAETEPLRAAAVSCRGKEVCEWEVSERGSLVFDAFDARVGVRDGILVVDMSVHVHRYCCRCCKRPRSRLMMMFASTPSDLLLYIYKSRTAVQSKDFSCLTGPGIGLLLTLSTLLRHESLQIPQQSADRGYRGTNLSANTCTRVPIRYTEQSLRHSQNPFLRSLC